MESGFILIDRQLQTSRQGQQQRGHRTYYFCETSKETSAEEEPISLCVGSSRKRHARFLEKKLAGKPVLALPEEKSITTVPEVPDAVDSLCVKELENTSPIGGSSRDLVSLEAPTSSPDSDPDLSINERAILDKFLDTVNIDSDDSNDDLSSVYSVCSNCKRPPEKGEELKRCSRCHITPYCSIQCQRKIGTFTDLLVPLWPRGRTLSKLKSCYCLDLYIFLILVFFCVRPDLL